MSRPPYWSDPYHRPPPVWVVPIVLCCSASAGFAVARFCLAVATRRKP